MYRSGLGIYETVAPPALPYSIAPPQVITLAQPGDGLNGLGCPGLGCAGLGAFDFSTVTSALPSGVLPIAAVAVGGFLLWRALKGRGGKSGSRVALRRARYEYEAKRAAELAKA